MQFEFALWTREMVREVIRREFGVALSVVSVGRLLRKLGMSPQRPLHRAYQQNPEAVNRWKREEYPAIQAQAEAAGAVIDFCKRLLHDAPGPVYLIVDGHPAHRATATKEFAARTEGRLKLFFLPGYSPELNPDEWVWKNVKHDRIGKTGVTSRQDLKAKAIGALRRLQKRPGLVRAFFADPHLRYIAA